MFRRSFTLIELLVVIAIVGLLSTVAVVAMNPNREKARLVGARSFAAQIDRFAGSESVGSWNFDECSGTSLSDNSGYNNNGTMSSAPVWSSNTPGGTGCALNFDGVDDYIDLGTAINTILPSGSSDRTVSAWIYLTSCTGGLKHIFHYGNYASNNTWGLALLCVSSTEIRMGAHEWLIGAGDFTGNVPMDKWVHLAITLSGGGTKTHYIDGHNVGVLTRIPNTTPTYSAKIGTRISPAEYFPGMIDDVRVYAQALTAREIGKMYAEGLKTRLYSMSAQRQEKKNSCIIND